MILLNVVARCFPPLSPAGAALPPCLRRDEQEGELGSAHTATTSPYGEHTVTFSFSFIHQIHFSSISFSFSIYISPCSAGHIQH
jgi:hypothetical protein